MHFFLFFLLSTTKILGHYLEKRDKTKSWGKETDCLRNLGPKEDTVVNLASYVRDLELEKLATWNCQWVQTKKCPTKTCTLYRKDQERGNLARQEIFSATAKHHRKKTVALPPFKQRQVESPNLYFHKVMTRYKTPLADSQRRLTRDLGLSPYLAILRCHLPSVWCQRRPMAHQQYHHCPLVRPPTLFPMVWIESHGKHKGGTLTSLLQDKERSMWA